MQNNSFRPVHRREAADGDPCSEEERQRRYRDVDYTWYHISLRSMTAQPVNRFCQAAFLIEKKVADDEKICNDGNVHNSTVHANGLN